MKCMMIIFIIISVSFVYADLNDGLVAHYPFNGNANDESGNGNDGTVSGAILTIDRFGNSNSAYYFDGFDDFIDCGNDSSFDITNEISSSCWIKFNSGTLAYIYDKGYGIGNDHPYSIYITTSSINAMLNGIHFSTDYNFLLNEWYHIIRSYDMVSQKVYLNGNLINEFPFSQNINTNTHNFQIGRRLPSDYYFNGNIDDMRIYNRFLTEDEVSMLYHDTYWMIPPEVTIEITSGNVNLSWDEVTGATSYTVYSDSDPYGSFGDTEYTGALSECSLAIPGDKKFYRVTASN